MAPVRSAIESFFSTSQLKRAMNGITPCQHIKQVEAQLEESSSLFSKEKGDQESILETLTQQVNCLNEILQMSKESWFMA